MCCEKGGEQGDMFMKVNEGECFQEAVTKSGNCHYTFNKRSKDKGL